MEVNAKEITKDSSHSHIKIRKEIFIIKHWLDKESYVPCKNAFTEKKTTVIAGPYSACPMTIFFNVENRSRFGKSFDMKLNQKCRVGPKITIPYPAMRSVLKQS